MAVLLVPVRLLLLLGLSVGLPPLLALLLPHPVLHFRCQVCSVAPVLLGKQTAGPSSPAAQLLPRWFHLCRQTPRERAAAQPHVQLLAEQSRPLSYCRGCHWAHLRRYAWLLILRAGVPRQALISGGPVCEAHRCPTTIAPPKRCPAAGATALPRTIGGCAAGPGPPRRVCWRVHGLHRRSFEIPRVPMINHAVAAAAVAVMAEVGAAAAVAAAVPVTACLDC